MIEYKNDKIQEKYYVEVLENGNQKFKIKYKYKIVDYITWKERFYK